MIRPAVLSGDQGRRRRPRVPALGPSRVKVGTRMRTGVGVIEVTEVERVPLSGLRADDAARAGAASLAALKQELAHRTDRPVWRVGSGTRARTLARRSASSFPDADEIAADPQRGSTGSTRRRRHRALDPRHAGDHRPQPGGPGTRPGRAARTRDAGMEDRRPQAEGARADRVAGDRLPPLPARRGRARRRARRARAAAAPHGHPSSSLHRCARHSCAAR